MENTGVAVLALAFLLLFPSKACVIAPLSALLLFYPHLKRSQRRRELDGLALRIGLKLSSLPVITEKRIVEELKEFEGYERAERIYRTTGRFIFPVFGERSAFLENAVKLALKTGNTKLMREAVRNLGEIEEVMKEINSLLSTEKYTLLGSFAALGLVFGIITHLSHAIPWFYLGFQTFLGALWLKDISHEHFLQALILVFFLVFGGFQIGFLVG